MIKVGVITRGKYGARFVETVKKRTPMEVVHAEVPENLPEVIEEPSAFLKGLGEDVFKVDLLVLFSLHPDINLELARMASERGVRSVIIAGGYAKAPLGELQKLKNVNVKVEDICCALRRSGDKTINKFASFLGHPEFSVRVGGDRITEVDVLRGAPCGATWWVAENLKGCRTKEAAARAGLLTQMYPCRATRGVKGNIHKAAEIHRKAMEKALKSATR